MDQSSTKITSDNTQDIDDSEKNNSVNAIKEQVATIKEQNSRSVESINQRNEKSKNQLSKAKPEKVSYRNHRRLYVERCSRERYEQG